MVAETSNHTPATFQENSGFRLNGFPAMGAWLSYGLGTEADDLPAFVVIPDARELPPGGAINWSNGFLPARHQGVMMRPKGEPIDDLFPARPIADDAEAAARDLLERPQPKPPRPPRGRRRPGRTHPQLRTGRPACSSPSRRSPGFRAKRGKPWRSTESTGPRPATSAAPACWPGG